MSLVCSQDYPHITYFFTGVRRGRSARDIPSCQSALITVENTLSSLMRNLKTHLQERLVNNPTPDLIKEMGRCLDLGDILEVDETLEVKEMREKSLKKVMQKAKCEKKEQNDILKQYRVFKKLVKDMNDPISENDEIVSRFQHLLFETHACQPNCVMVMQQHVGFKNKWNVQVCPKKGELLQPRQPKLMRIIHLIYKEPSLYSGIENFLHFLLRYKLLRDNFFLCCCCGI